MCRRVTASSEGEADAGWRGLAGRSAPGVVLGKGVCVRVRPAGGLQAGAPSTHSAHLNRRLGPLLKQLCFGCGPLTIAECLPCASRHHSTLGLKGVESQVPEEYGFSVFQQGLQSGVLDILSPLLFNTTLIFFKCSQ